MTLFSLLISSVNRELVFAVDSIRHPWLNFQRWFLVLQWLSFRWLFMHKHWHCVFDDSMRQTWIYFYYRFYASLMHSLTQSTPYVSCHSYFSGDLKVYSDSVFDDDSMRHTWIYFCYRFYVSLVNSLTLSTPYVSCHSYFIGDFKVNSHSVFADDFLSIVT